MHSHHSHSGDYIAHGVDPLEDVTEQAVKMKFHTYCLTEHMPRINPKFLYPEEYGNTMDDAEAVDKLQSNFSKFLKHAKIIKDRPNEFGTKFLVGVEIEGCDVAHIEYGKRLIEENSDIVKFCVGSVHHVHDIPVDFDQEQWNQALEASDCNIKSFLLAYFDLQYIMLTTLKPLVVGHFDLYKLYLPDDLKINPQTGQCSKDGVPVSQISLINQWDSVKKALVRNLQFINSYGGVIEINTSALRKKLPEPYPGREIGALVKKYCDGRFVLSDDAHGVSQVGVCYKKALEYIVDVLKLEQMFYLEEDVNGAVIVKALPIEEFESNIFWKNYS